MHTRVLVIGANGFIGSAIVASLQRAGFRTRCIVRRPGPFSRRFPDAETQALDLTTAAAQDTACWVRLLEGIDAVVNVAGVLQPDRTSAAWAVHHTAPAALFSACERSGVRRVIHVSATGIMETETAYARSKRAGEESLMAKDLDWTVLRPVIVVGDGSYGGSSLLRALAVFPWVTPVLGDGNTPIDVIHKDDLAAGIVELLCADTGLRAVLEPAGADRMTLLEVVAAYRRWFGLPQRPVLRIPNWLARVMARVGDVTRMHPVTSTALNQFRARLTGNVAAFEEVTGTKPSGLADILAARPCESQDLWHARLFLLRPLIRLSLALLWMGSGLAGLLGHSALYESVAALHDWGAALTGIAGTIDLAVALALLLGWRLRLMAWVQVALVLGYTVGLGMLVPALWADPFGSLLKNIPILVLLLVHRVVEEER